LLRCPVPVPFKVGIMNSPSVNALPGGVDVPAHRDFLARGAAGARRGRGLQGPEVLRRGM